MSDTTQIKVPDIGDFKDVDVIEVHVKPGDEVAAEDPLITLETDKASMDVPAPAAGRIDKLLVAVGDKVSEGSVIAELSAGEGTQSSPAQAGESTGGKAGAGARGTKPAAIAAPPAAEFGGDADMQAQLVVLGAGPGGYTAAFRAADLGLEVI